MRVKALLSVSALALLASGCLSGPPAEPSAGNDGPPLQEFQYVCGPAARPLEGGTVCFEDVEEGSPAMAHEVTVLVHRKGWPETAYIAVRTTDSSSPIAVSGSSAMYSSDSHVLVTHDGGVSWDRIELPDWPLPDGVPPTAVRTDRLISALLVDADGDVHLAGRMAFWTGSGLGPPVLADDMAAAFYVKLTGGTEWQEPAIWEQAAPRLRPALVREGSGALAFWRIVAPSVVQPAVSWDDGASWAEGAETQDDCLYQANGLLQNGAAIMACFNFEGSSPVFAFDPRTQLFERLGTIPTDDIRSFINWPVAGTFGDHGIAFGIDDTEGAKWYVSLDGGRTWDRGFDLSTSTALEGGRLNNIRAFAGDAAGRLHVMARAIGPDDGTMVDTVRFAHLVLDIPAQGFAGDVRIGKATILSPEQQPPAAVFVAGGYGALSLEGTEGFMATDRSERTVAVARLHFE